MANYWDRMAKLYAGFVNLTYKKAYAEIVANTKPYISANDEVLEVGAGPGNLTKALAPCAKVWVATDYSANMVAEAAKVLSEYKQVRVEQQDVCNLTYGDQSFQVVLASNLLHIIPNPQQALQEMARVLRPGGLLIAPTFLLNSGSLFSKGIGRFLAWTGCAVHSRWTMKSYCEFLQQHNWQVSEAKVIKGKMNIGFVVASYRLCDA